MHDAVVEAQTGVRGEGWKSWYLIVKKAASTLQVEQLIRNEPVDLCERHADSQPIGKTVVGLHDGLCRGVGKLDIRLAQAGHLFNGLWRSDGHGRS